MKIFDLSHPLHDNSPVYPGKSKPEFRRVVTIATDGYRETHFSFDSHLGTHIDAPSHMLEKGKSLDQLSIESFSGDSVIIAIPDGTSHIEKPFLLKFEDELKTVDFVLFKTGWSRFWGSSKYFINFPVLTPDALNWLLSFSLKGIGFDAISADPVESTGWENHLAIFGKELIIIENLVFPGELAESRGLFCCFPIPYENADGSPVRAVILVLK
jgi:arylformamidase